MTSCYSIPGYYLMLEGSATSAGNLEWFVNQFFQSEKQTAKEQGTFRSACKVRDHMGGEGLWTGEVAVK